MKKLFAFLFLVCSAAYAQTLPTSLQNVKIDANGNVLPITVNGHAMNLPPGATVNGVPIGGGGSGGGGSVSLFSFNNANGITGIVANATTTPTLTISLGAIIPGSVNGIIFTGSSSPSLAVTGASSISGANTGDQTSITGNAGTATKLVTPRTIGMTGDMTWSSGSFDGSGNVTGAGTLATVNSDVGSFTAANITVDAKGRVTAAASGGGGGGSGDVVGPSSSIDGEFALFSSTTGKLIRRATGTGLVSIVGGVQQLASASTVNNLINSTVAPVFTNVTSRPTTLVGYGITDGQPLDADLTYLAGFTPTANVKTILNAADFAAVRVALGVVIGTNVQAFSTSLVTWSGIVPGTNVGTFLTTPTGANLAAALTTAIPYSKGGTGATSLTTNGVVTAGASALTTVAPGAFGNVLQSNGTNWTSGVLTTSGNVVSSETTNVNGDFIVLDSTLDGKHVRKATALEAYSYGLDPGYDFIPFWNTGDTWQKFTVSTDMAGALDTAIPTENAVRSFVLANSFDGTWSGLTGVPGPITSWSLIARPLAFDTFAASQTSANFLAMITNETGTGLVMGNSGPNIDGFADTGIAKFSSDVTPTALVGQTDNYNPTNLASAFALRLDAGGADRDLTGIANPSAGRVLHIINVGATNNITLKEESGSSTTTNRFVLGGDVILSPKQEIFLRYDGTTTRWRPFGRGNGISDAVYDSSWDADTTHSATKNAIFDKIETLSAGTVSDTAYAPSWDGTTTIAPSKNAVFDKVETLRVGTVTAVFNGGGSALGPTNTVMPWTAPYAGSITGWSISVDTGTATFKVWKKANGTAIPTITDVINTSGVAISTGTHIRSSTVTDFTSTTVTAGDMFIVALTTVATATNASFELEITK